MGRRSFLSGISATAAGAASAGGIDRACFADEPKSADASANIEHAEYHYKEPFDYGVMQGPVVSEDDRVTKVLSSAQIEELARTLVSNQPLSAAAPRADSEQKDLRTCFFCDQRRMRWALQHMSVLQRTLPIARSGDIVRFEYRPLDLSDVNVASADGREIDVAEWLKLTETDGFMVVYLSRELGPIAATEQYFNGMKPHSLHHLWSVSKSFAAGVIAIAIERGKLKREDKVGSILPELASSGLAGASLDNVLNMASGTKFYEGKEWSVEGLIRFAMGRAFVAADFLELEKEDPAVQDLGWTKFLASIGKDRDHGKAFEYKDADSRTAAAMAERALGGRFDQLFTDLIWSKIGAEHDAWVCCDPLGSASTPFGFSATLRDCARWGLCHLSDWPRKVIPSSFIRNLTTPHSTYASPESRKMEKTPEGYRDQYWVDRSGPAGSFHARGWMGQRIQIYPALSVVIVQLASLWPDRYVEQVPDCPAFATLAEHVAKTYREQGA